MIWFLVWLVLVLAAAAVLGLLGRDLWRRSRLLVRELGAATDRLTEITDLSEADSAMLWQEIRLATGVMQALSKPDKVNLGALGNVVSQLHVHIVGRFRSDPAWPGPVWGFETRKPYPLHARAQLLERAGALFSAA